MPVLNAARFGEAIGSIDLMRDLSPDLRQTARVGCHLTTYRYSGADWWRRTQALYAAVLTDPKCVMWQSFPRRELLQPARQGLSRAKQRVLAKKRTFIA